MRPSSDKPRRATNDARVFPATHWTRIVSAQGGSEEDLNHIFAAYREPLIGYAKTWTNSHHDAEDVVQSFLLSLVRRNFLALLSREKGRFRTFLLTSLRNFLHEDFEKRNALKRGAGKVTASLDETDIEGNPLQSPADPDPAADIQFDRAWARTVIEKASRRLSDEASKTKNPGLFRALHRCLNEDPTSPRHREIAKEFGMTENTVKVTAHRHRRRLRALVEEEVLTTLSTPADLVDEVQYLMQLFQKG